MVKVGIKSKKGNISSRKLNKAPTAPFFPPKLAKNMMAEMGAQTRSPNSPRNGTAKVSMPMASMIKQKSNDGDFFT